MGGARWAMGDGRWYQHVLCPQLSRCGVHVQDDESEAISNARGLVKKLTRVAVVYCLNGTWMKENRHVP